MALNLRSKIATPVQTLVTLFTERAEKVNKKGTLEKEITDQNGKLTRELQAIFKPLAVKSKIGFHLSIRDEDVEVSTQFHITRKETKKPRTIGNFRMCLSTIPIASWMASPSEFGSYLSLIETNLRYLNRLTSTSRGEGKITFTNPNTVTISIDTRNRYF
jgi:hypothetical protein